MSIATRRPRARRSYWEGSDSAPHHRERRAARRCGSHPLLPQLPRTLPFDNQCRLRLPARSQPRGKRIPQLGGPCFTRSSSARQPKQRTSGKSCIATLLSPLPACSPPLPQRPVADCPATPRTSLHRGAPQEAPSRHQQWSTRSARRLGHHCLAMQRGGLHGRKAGCHKRHESSCLPPKR